MSGLWSIDKKTFKADRRLYTGDKLDDCYLKSICIDNRGRLWVGSYRAGLYIFDSDLNLVARFNKGNGFISSSVNDIFKIVGTVSGSVLTMDLSAFLIPILSHTRNSMPTTVL